jgi:hypothetical protein
MVESNCKAIVIERIIYLTNIALATVYAILTPYVQILIKLDSKDNGTNASILMQNTGGAAAKHVKLIDKTPEKIAMCDIFSTENITLGETGPKLLEANMQRFVQGAGSFVNISLMIKAKPSINYTKSYAAFATYDQGSTIGGFSLKSPQYLTYIIYFIIYVPVSIFVILYLRRLIYRRTIKRLQYFLIGWKRSSDPAANKKRALEIFENNGDRYRSNTW